MIKKKLSLSATFDYTEFDMHKGNFAFKCIILSVFR